MMGTYLLEQHLALVVLYQHMGYAKSNTRL
jgi:hypothetical protein